MPIQLLYSAGKLTKYPRQRMRQYIPWKSTYLESGQVEMAAGHDTILLYNCFANTVMGNRSIRKWIRIWGHESLEQIYETAIKFVAVMYEICIQQSLQHFACRTIGWRARLCSILSPCGKVGRSVEISVTRICSIGHQLHCFAASVWNFGTWLFKVTYWNTLRDVGVYAEHHILMQFRLHDILLFHVGIATAIDVRPIISLAKMVLSSLCGGILHQGNFTFLWYRVLVSDSFFDHFDRNTVHVY